MGRKMGRIMTESPKDDVMLPATGEMKSDWIRDVTTKTNNLSHDTRVLIAANNALANRVNELELQVESILEVLGTVVL